MPSVLSRAGMPVLKKLVSYDGTETSAQNRLILFLKKNKNLRVSHFVAEQLLYRLREILDENSLAAQDTVIVFLPRSPKNLAKYGFDQTELVAKELSRISGVELLPLLKRKRKNYKEQKRLDLKGRRDNVRFMFELDGECLSSLGERCIILLDDIVTSGSSMAEAIRLLRKRGVREVYGLCIAMVKVKRRHA